MHAFYNSHFYFSREYRRYETLLLILIFFLGGKEKKRKKYKNKNHERDKDPWKLFTIRIFISHQNADEAKQNRHSGNKETTESLRGRVMDGFTSHSLA